MIAVSSLDSHQLTSHSSVPSSLTGIPILSFFSGAGFLDIGFMQGGFNSIWRNEYDPNFVKGFVYGMSALTGSELDSQIHNSDSIVNLGPNQIAREAFNNMPSPSLFGFIGGPPCPDFSVGGKNMGGQGERGKLSQVYVNRILELKPAFFLFENVPGLLRTSKHRLFLINLLEQLSRYYLLDLKILNALDYGVPQDRERVFLVGFRKNWLKASLGLSLPSNVNDWLIMNPVPAVQNSLNLPGMGSYHWFPWPRDERYENAKKRFEWPLKTPFREKPEKPCGIPEELMVHKYICNLEETAALPNGLEAFEPKSDKFDLIAEGDDSRKSFKRLHRWRYSPAAAYGNNEVHLHPTEPRRLTVREALRIQTVPDKYSLPPEMPLSHKFKTIGNGVPVKLAKVMAVSIKKVLEGKFDANF